MRLRVDHKTDALYFRLDDSEIIESEEVHPDVILDYDAHDNVVGVEVLNLSKRPTKVNLSTIDFEIL